MFEEIEIKRIKLAEGASFLKDKAAREIPFTISVNDQQIATLLASPSKLKELAAGYLYAEGFIIGEAEIKNLLVDEKAFTAAFETGESAGFDQVQKKRVITSGCGRNISFYNFEDFLNCPPVRSDLKVGAEKILELAAEFQKMSEMFKQTGGVHSAALCDKEKIIGFAEDIGRHNAADKVIGALILEGARPDGKFLLLSGRISSEMLLKAARIGFPIIVSRSAPTDLAARLAKQLKIALVGFARGERMNIYSAEERIICQK